MERVVKVDLCAVLDIPAEGSKEVDFFDRKVHVVRAAGGVPAAFLDVCLHLGGPMVCKDGQFECQWHQATFERETGRRLSGPAPEGSRLMRLPPQVEDGVLKYVYGEEDPVEVEDAA